MTNASSRPRLQFSLRWLFVLAAIMGVGMLVTRLSIRNQELDVEHAVLRAQIAQLQASNAQLDRSLRATQKRLAQEASQVAQLKADAQRERLEMSENPHRLPHFVREGREP
jgi:Tfp pilus assembly protein PilN